MVKHTFVVQHQNNQRMNRFFTAVAIIGLSFTAFLSASAAPPKKYVVDTAATSLNWLAKKVTGSHNGTIKVSGGDITIDGVKVQSGNFAIDMNSMVILDIQGGSNAKLLGHLKSDDFFSVDKFPSTNFVLTSVTQKSGSTYTVKGKLTIKGITQEIEFPAEIGFSGKTMTAKAKITVDRTKFEIKYRSSNWFENLGDKAIYDDFELELNLVAKTS
jgi:polyisoprenoid-binding protein YceI